MTIRAQIKETPLYIICYKETLQNIQKPPTDSLGTHDDGFIVRSKQNGKIFEHKFPHPQISFMNA